VETIPLGPGNLRFKDGFGGTASVACGAPPRIVYGLLADLRTHIVWGGKSNGSPQQHLLAIDCPIEPAIPGTEFRSVGYTSHGSWHDQSRVTVATPNTLFEFVTVGTMRSDPPFHGSWVHRYEIKPDGSGCQITYTCQWQLTKFVADGPRLRPSVFCQVVLPSIWEAGLRGLAAMAKASALAEDTG
jgi:hypothetical protein